MHSIDGFHERQNRVLIEAPCKISAGGRIRNALRSQTIQEIQESFIVATQLDIFEPQAIQQRVVGQIQNVELPRARARHKKGEIEVVPVLLYPMDDLEHDCKFLYRLNPLPEWGKSWRDFEKDGDWQDALFPIGKGVKQAIEKARLRCAER